MTSRSSAAVNERSMISASVLPVMAPKSMRGSTRSFQSVTSEPRCVKIARWSSGAFITFISSATSICFSRFSSAAAISATTSSTTAIAKRFTIRM